MLVGGDAPAAAKVNYSWYLMSSIAGESLPQGLACR